MPSIVLGGHQRDTFFADSWRTDPATTEAPVTKRRESYLPSGTRHRAGAATWRHASRS
jgi:hypothetical protein